MYKDRGICTKDIYPFRITKGCMRQQLNSFVIGPKGDLYKCWHHLGMEECKVGNIADDKYISNLDLLSDMMIDNDIIFDDKCKECVLFPSCYGGCADLRNMNEDYCIPAKSGLEDFLDIYYITKNK